MFDLTKEWSISFAGCGFMGMYYVGASSCILERFPALIQGASKIYGSSSGSLIAVVLATGIPLEESCTDLMSMAKQARKHRLGPFHPAFSLVQMVQDSLQRSLPEDAHVRASGRLCVSLTRMPDRKNVLVSEFDTREELIQVLLCSCFVPLYCGVVPPTYRGVHYVDGAVSDNLPRCHLKDTVTFSPYAGESDICPPAGTMNLHEVRFNNVSIQVSSENMYRVASTFFPPEAEVMCQICQHGYNDALRFLQVTNLITSESPLSNLETDSPGPAHRGLVNERDFVEEEKESTDQDVLKPYDDEHVWLNPQLTQNLPLHIRRVFYKARRESHTADGLFSHMAEYLPKIPRTLPVESAYALAHRLVNWVQDVPKDMSRLYGMAEGLLPKKVWENGVGDDDDNDRESLLRRCASLPLGLNIWSKDKDDVNTPPSTPENTPTSNLLLTWDKGIEMDHLPLTPPPTPTPSPSPCETSKFGDAATKSPNSADGGWRLGRAVGWIRNMASERTLQKQENK